MFTSSSNQSIISILTVHSKNKQQKANQHWMIRFNERGDCDIQDKNLKDYLMQELKKQLKEGGTNVRYSKERPNRVCVTV